MLHRIRNAADTSEFNIPLDGTVEIDETYIGGKESNKHESKRTEGTQGAGSIKTKAAVSGMVERNGKLKLKHIDATSGKAIQPIVTKNVFKSATINTDESRSYSWVRDVYRHEFVIHSAGEYIKNVDGKAVIYTNTIEGVFSHFKRTIIGVYYQVSKKHLSRYTEMFSFRWNTQNLGDGHRVNLLLMQTVEGDYFIRDFYVQIDLYVIFTAVRLNIE